MIFVCRKIDVIIDNAINEIKIFCVIYFDYKRKKHEMLFLYNAYVEKSKYENFLHEFDQTRAKHMLNINKIKLCKKHVKYLQKLYHMFRTCQMLTTSNYVQNIC